MSLEAVRAFFAAQAPEIVPMEAEARSATVAQAAEAFGVAPEQIAKTLALRVGDEAFLLVMSGAARLDNRKAKQAFGGKPRLLDADEVVALTGHPVGGVCPFGLPGAVAVYCDASLRAFPEVLPAAGSVNSAVRLNPERLAELVAGRWVDVAREEETAV